MTLIEFFEKESVENVCSCLVAAPERVVFIGDSKRQMQKHAAWYQEVFAARGKEIEFVCKTVNKNSVQSIIEALISLAETYDDCVFDVTGGDDAYLVAMGIVSERCRERNIQIHRINVRNNRIQDCDMDGRVFADDPAPVLSVDENIRIYGGKIIYDDVRSLGTHRWVWDETLREQIDAMWEICRQDVRRWNVQIGVFAAAEKFRKSNPDPMVTQAPGSYISDHLESVGYEYKTCREVLLGLYDRGLIRAYECGGENFEVIYKNPDVKRCLTKAGQVLEMKIFSEACAAREHDGSRTYNDVMTGVCIDWDGEIHPNREAFDTENEMDVIMMHGMIPVFVSCKNGKVEMDELYKLSTVARRFGGSYAKKVLVTTALNTMPNVAPYLKQRARDMDIIVLDTVQDMDAVELTRTIRSLWR